jgi:hypothetical protein
VRLPKFWNDRGGNNEAVVSLCITVCLLSFGLATWRLGRPPFGFAGLPLALLGGCLAGLTLVGLLCTYFRVEDK